MRKGAGARTRTHAHLTESTPLIHDWVFNQVLDFKIYSEQNIQEG